MNGIEKFLLSAQAGIFFFFFLNSVTINVFNTILGDSVEPLFKLNAQLNIGFRLTVSGSLLDMEA